MSEIFGPTIQGEGLVIGQPTIFVRFGGCDYRCSWCDTLYAVDPKYRSEWLQMTPEQIVQTVVRLSGGVPMMVTLSGGNPVLFNLSELVDLLHDLEYKVQVETQGSVPAPWLHKVDALCISPKPPSSGMGTDFDALTSTLAMRPTSGTYLKIVVFNEEDYVYARVVATANPGFPYVLQAGTQTADRDDANNMTHAILDRTAWLANRVLEDLPFWRGVGRVSGAYVRVLPQMHSLLWGRKRAV